VIADVGDVDVHYVELDDIDASQAHVVLDGHEQQRAGRFRLPLDRDRYTRAHVALRLLLARYVSADPRALAFDRRCLHCGDPRHGKPRLVPMTHDFNMSHADGVAVIAVTIADRQRVGVDVESVRRAPAIAEAGDLVDGDDPGRPSSALGPVETWTAKEAFAKACGLGLRLELPDIIVEPGAVRHPEVGVSRHFEQSRYGDHVVSVVSLAVGGLGRLGGPSAGGVVRWFGRSASGRRRVAAGHDGVCRGNARAELAR
jgi:4'-phosphopantetheinyl transferase